MKKTTLVALFTFVLSLAFGQTVVISETAATPDPSAVLDIQSESKGLLVPRMTASDRMDIPSPAEGLIVYQTDDEQGFYYYDGSAWSVFVNSNQITDFGSGMVITDEERTTLGNAVLSNAGFPTMTYAERNAMTDAFEGMVIYQSDNTKGLRVYNGNNWSLQRNAIAFIKDIKSDGVHGGTSFEGTWMTRDINTLEGDSDFVTIKENLSRFSLEPGEYTVEAMVPGYRMNNSVIRLYDVTDYQVSITGNPVMKQLALALEYLISF